MLALLWPAALCAEELPQAVQGAIDDARADCESFEAGDFSFEPEAIIKTPLTQTADGWLVDETHMRCSSAASMYCGTGGCGLFLIVGDHITERLAKAWSIVDFYDRPVVLLDVHGSLCGGINPTPCVEALIWDDEASVFTTLAPRDQ